MTLLYLEDNEFLRRQTAKYLREDGYVVNDCRRIDQANQYLSIGGDVDCIITDLNMEDRWLGEYQKESEGCLLSGWVWLRRFVNIEDRFKNIPCIIYSGYLAELNSYLIRRGEASLIDEYHVYLVGKGGNNDHGYNALHDTLNKIFKDYNDGR